MKIRIKKRTQSGQLMWLIIVLPFLFGVLNSVLNLPNEIRYIIDFAWASLLLMMLSARSAKSGRAKQLAVWIILFFVYTLFVYPVQYQAILYYLWGARNNFRFYVAFLSFTVFLTIQDAEDYLKIFDKLFWINAVVSLVQFFGFGIYGDSLGGLFGVASGVNGYTNTLFAIMTVKSLVFYLDKRETAWSSFSKCAAMLIVAALAELKFFYVEFIAIVVMAVLFTNFTWRKFWIVFGSMLGVLGGATLLSNLFPGFAGWFSVEWLLEAASTEKGYTSSGDLNRLNAIPQMNELWLTNWGQRLFGLGLGNCDTSSYAIVNTPFFEQYGDMHYTWISYAFMYLETGYIGLLFYVGFFVLVFFLAGNVEKRSEGITKTYCRIARIMAVCCVMICVYNSSLRTEAGYMAYFVLALPFLRSNVKKKPPFVTGGTE